MAPFFLSGFKLETLSFSKIQCYLQVEKASNRKKI